MLVGDDSVDWTFENWMHREGGLTNRHQPLLDLVEKRAFLRVIIHAVTNNILRNEIFNNFHHEACARAPDDTTTANSHTDTTTFFFHKT